MYSSCCTLFILILTGYKWSGTTSGCCVSDGVHGFHRRCICEPSVKIDDCQSICDEDDYCRGYTMRESCTQQICNPKRASQSDCDAHRTCELATRSECPNGCKRLHDEGTHGILNPAADCGKGEYTGCFIKNSKHTNYVLQMFSQCMKV